MINYMIMLTTVIGGASTYLKIIILIYLSSSIDRHLIIYTILIITIILIVILIVSFRATPSDNSSQLMGDAMRKRAQMVYVKCGTLFIDEYAQLPPSPWHDMCLVWKLPREYQYDLKRQHYAEPRETAGRTAKVILSGEHLQLPLVPAIQDLKWAVPADS